MFDFLKPHKTTTPIFSVLGTDMHSHLIPGVDDGAKNYDEALECIRRMWEVGYRKICVTPHFQFPRYPNDEDDIRRRFEDLKAKVAEAGIGMELACVGGEYRIDDGFADRVQNQKFLLVNNNYVLVELSLHQQRMGVSETVFDLQMKGYEVIMAHPERYPYLGATSPVLEKLKDQGVLFQVNVLSLSGFYGEIACKTGYELIRKGWVELLGTDMHSVVYAKALVDACSNKQVQRVLDKCEFMNSKL